MRSSDDSATETTDATAPSDLTGIEMVYRTLDRFEHQHADPNIAYAERIEAEVTGVDYESDRRVRLGSVSLVRIDFWEVGDRWFDVLDAESSEWAAYHDVVADAGDDDRFLLIVDRAEIVEWARGHDIGLHAVARAIRTWGEDARSCSRRSRPAARVRRATPAGRRSRVTGAARARPRPGQPAADAHRHRQLPPGRRRRGEAQRLASAGAGQLTRISANS